MDTTVNTHEERGVASEVTVTTVENPLDLYCQYPGQSGPQPCFVQFSLETGELSAGYNPEIGGGVPFPVWNGVIRRWRIPCLKADTANTLMESLSGPCQSLLDDPDTRVYHDGSNWVGRADDFDIAGEIDGREWYPEHQVQVWDAADYLGVLVDVARELEITPDTTDEEIRAIVEHESREVDVLEGAVEYLTRVRDELTEEEED